MADLAMSLRMQRAFGCAVLVFAGAAFAARINPPGPSIRGTVIEVEETTCPACRQVGVTAVLRLENDRKLTVLIAPKSYFELCDFRLRQGDVIDVAGERVRRDGVEVLVAYTLKRGNESLTLRDADGRPMWESRRCARCGY